jgi:hypothetical protein
MYVSKSVCECASACAPAYALRALRLTLTREATVGMQLDAHVSVENLRKLLSELHSLAFKALSSQGVYAADYARKVSAVRERALACSCGMGRGMHLSGARGIRQLQQ